MGRILQRGIEGRAWRSTVEAECLDWLQPSEKKRKPEVVAMVRAAFDAAGAGFSGRWQG